MQTDSYHYRQETCEGCLAVCLFQISGLPSSAAQEITVLSAGLSRIRTSYALAIATGFALTTGVHVELVIENSAYAKQLEAELEASDGKVALTAASLRTPTDLDRVGFPCVLYVDSHTVSGTVEHAPHFITVLKDTGSTFIVSDPLDGAVHPLSHDIITKGIESLRRRFRFSPVALRLLHEPKAIPGSHK